MELEDLVEVPPVLRGMRRYALDGALLLFDRRTGMTALCDGEETRHLCRRVPRVVQFAITNACNLACSFCSRDTDEASAWTLGTALAMLRDLSRAGTLEVAFGGGEPFVFRGFPQLLHRLRDETELAVSVTTNGTRLDDAMLDAIAGAYAQLRVSLYDETEWRTTLARLVARRAAFGVNYLVTPARLPQLEDTVAALVALGCPDVLLLAYNGDDPALHLDRVAWADTAARIARLARVFPGVALKLDICWGDRLAGVPQLFGVEPCRAGADFVVITSDGKLRPCSFHQLAIPVATADDVLRVWREMREPFASPAARPGCARSPDFGYGRLARRLPLVTS
ncbi:MAG: radical SAM protein [Kofleriaceae bacterium]